MFDHMKEALKRHVSKAKALAPSPSDKNEDPEPDQDDFMNDHAPEVKGDSSPVKPEGDNLAPNAHASGEDEQSLEHMKNIQALLGHGGPLSKAAYASASGGGDKDKEKMASIMKSKKMHGGY